MPDFLATIVGVGLVLVVLWETFETIVLPRRVTRQFRFTRAFYRWTWYALSPDRVRQMAEQSLDGGKTWRTTWDSVYVRKAH